jgi:hypothetical protein
MFRVWTRSALQSTFSHIHCTRGDVPPCDTACGVRDFLNEQIVYGKRRTGTASLRLSAQPCGKKQRLDWNFRIKSRKTRIFQINVNSKFVQNVDYRYEYRYKYTKRRLQ